MMRPLGRNATRVHHVFFALGCLAVALVAMFVALVIVVAIEPLGWHLLASFPFLVIGTIALLLFSDGLDRTMADDAKLRRASSMVRWGSAALVALAIAVLTGIVATSVFGYSPATGWAILIDVGIGLFAGGLMLLIVAGSAAALGPVVDSVAGFLGAGEEREGLRTPFRKRWSRLEALRALALGAVGLLLSAGFAELFGPSTPSRSGAADTLPHHPSAWSTLGWPLLGWVVGTGAVWCLFARRTSGGISAQRGRRHVTHASALSVALLIALAWVTAAGLDSHARGGLSAGVGRVPQVTLAEATLTSSPALARSFAPILRLAPDERWSPTSVAWYRAHSTPDSHSQYLRLACPSSDARTCDPCDSPDPPKSCAPSGRDLPALYYRYYTPADARAQHDHLPLGRHDWTVIQYWIFYNYDSLNAGIITQWHESDWEQVSVLVERDGTAVRPVEVAYSEHCYGAIVPAGRVAWSGSHPISYSGRGSHGNYPTQSDLPIRELHCLTPTEPRYLGVAGLFFDPTLDGSASELPLAYVIGLRDSTGRTRTVSQPELIPAKTTGWNGYWGVDNNLTVLWGRLHTGNGPASPQNQNPWKQPFKAMYCAPTWLHVTSKTTHWVCS